jgi:uncharacterized protein (TIGR03086 family)
MTEIADRFRKLSDDFTDRVQAVPSDRWASPSPCEGWTAQDVVGHMVGNAGRFFALIGRDAPAGSPVDTDPAGAWLTVRDALQTALDDPAVASTPYESKMMGAGTFEQAVDRFGNFDLLVHTWDLARAAGLDDRLDPDEVHRVYQVAGHMDEMLRTPGVCGPKLDPPPGADEQTQLLAFLGRRV